MYQLKPLIHDSSRTLLHMVKHFLYPQSDWSRDLLFFGKPVPLNVPYWTLILWRCCDDACVNTHQVTTSANRNKYIGNGSFLWHSFNDHFLKILCKNCCINIQINLLTSKTPLLRVNKLLHTNIYVNANSIKN